MVGPHVRERNITVSQELNIAVPLIKAQEALASPGRLHRHYFRFLVLEYVNFHPSSRNLPNHPIQSAIRILQKRKRRRNHDRRLTIGNLGEKQDFLAAYVEDCSKEKAAVKASGDNYELKSV